MSENQEIQLYCEKASQTSILEGYDLVVGDVNEKASQTSILEGCDLIVGDMEETKCISTSGEKNMGINNEAQLIELPVKCNDMENDNMTLLSIKLTDDETLLPTEVPSTSMGSNMTLNDDTILLIDTRLPSFFGQMSIEDVKILPYVSDCEDSISDDSRSEDSLSEDGISDDAPSEAPSTTESENMTICVTLVSNGFNEKATNKETVLSVEVLSTYIGNNMKLSDSKKGPALNGSCMTVFDDTILPMKITSPFGEKAVLIDQEAIIGMPDPSTSDSNNMSININTKLAMELPSNLDCNDEIVNDWATPTVEAPSTSVNNTIETIKDDINFIDFLATLEKRKDFLHDVNKIV